MTLHAAFDAARAGEDSVISWWSGGELLAFETMPKPAVYEPLQDVRFVVDDTDVWIGIPDSLRAALSEYAERLKCTRAVLLAQARRRFPGVADVEALRGLVGE